MKVKAVPIPTEQRFWGWVEIPPDTQPISEDYRGACWLWGGPTDKDGYGTWSGGLRKEAAYIYAWRLANGRSPAPGMELDHRCRSRLCVRASHLEEVTHKVNTLRSEGVTAVNARKTHCDKGHLLPADRKCRPCAAERVRQHRARKAVTKPK